MYWGTAVAQWLRCCATNRKVAGSIPASASGFFIDTKSFRSHYGPGVDSASNRNQYQEYFLEVKGGWCVKLTTLPPSCAVVTKSGNLNFLETSGPLQACNGTALCFILILTSYMRPGPPRGLFPSGLRTKNSVCITSLPLVPHAQLISFLI